MFLSFLQGRSDDNICFRKKMSLLSLKELAMRVAVKKNLQLEDLSTASFPVKELDALARMPGNYKVGRMNVRFSKYGGGVVASADEINEAKSTVLYRAAMCKMGPGRRFSVVRVVINGDIQWACEFDNLGCICSMPHTVIISSQNEKERTSKPGCYVELTRSIGTGKVVSDDSLYHEQQANKKLLHQIRWELELADNDNLKMHLVDTDLRSNNQLSFTSSAFRI